MSGSAAEDNLKLVQGMYAAFAKSDFEGFFAGLSAEVVLESPGPARVPNFGVWRGPGEVGAFFGALGQNEDIRRFEPQEFVANDNQVVVIGIEEATVRTTGRSFSQQFVQVHTIRDGKVVRMRLFADTAAVARAYSQAP
jgi:ketosteroid isomerase-like protein